MPKAKTCRQIIRSTTVAAACFLACAAVANEGIYIAQVATPDATNAGEPDLPRANMVPNAELGLDALPPLSPNGNSAMIRQSGIDNTAILNMAGIGNQALQRQSGFDNTSILDVRGRRNIAVVNQDGSRLNSDVTVGSLLAPATDKIVVHVQRGRGNSTSDRPIDARAFPSDHLIVLDTVQGRVVFDGFPAHSGTLLQRTMR